jgi:hypothetical protein
LGCEHTGGHYYPHHTILTSYLEKEKIKLLIGVKFLFIVINTEISHVISYESRIYEKLVILRGGHIQEGKGKRRKLRR